MALERSNFQLFGIDLYRFYEQGRQAAADLARSAWGQRLLPDLAVTAWLPDGSRRPLYPGGAPAAAAQGDFTAVVLPADLVLDSSLCLPATASAADCARAVQFAVAADSPFAAADTLSAWHAEEGADACTVHYLIVARSQLERWLRGQTLPAGHEIWAPVGDRLLLIPGHGEQRRLHARRRQGWTAAALFALVLVLVLVLAAVPVLQRRQQVFAAQDAFHALAARTAAVVSARAELGTLNQQLTELAAAAAELPPPTPLLLRLTALLPDGAHLSQLNLSGSEFVLRGTADNASALVEALASTPGFSEVRPAAAIVRNAVTGRETFIIQGRHQPAEAEAEAEAREAA